MDDSCPKCGAPRDGESCPRCGVVFEKFDASVIEEGVSEDVLRLWQHVEEDWSDRARHALFVEQSILFGALGYAAGCYRKKGDDPVAVEQLGRISSRLEQSMSQTSSSRETPGPSRRMTIIVIVVLMLAVAGLLFYMLGR